MRGRYNGQEKDDSQGLSSLDGCTTQELGHHEVGCPQQEATGGHGGNHSCRGWKRRMKEAIPDLGFLSQERLCRERPPKNSHTEACRHGCINSDSTLAREARTMPNRGHTAHHLHGKASRFLSAILLFPNLRGLGGAEWQRAHHPLILRWNLSMWWAHVASSKQGREDLGPRLSPHRLLLQPGWLGLYPTSSPLFLLQPTGVEGVSFSFLWLCSRACGYVILWVSIPHVFLLPLFSCWSSLDANMSMVASRICEKLAFFLYKSWIFKTTVLLETLRKAFNLKSHSWVLTNGILPDICLLWKALKLIAPMEQPSQLPSQRIPVL